MLCWHGPIVLGGSTRSDLTLRTLHPLLLDLGLTSPGHAVGSHSVSDIELSCMSVLCI